MVSVFGDDVYFEVFGVVDVLFVVIDCDLG